jgi:hypothetical protein
MNRVTVLFFKSCELLPCMNEEIVWAFFNNDNDKQRIPGSISCVYLGIKIFRKFDIPLDTFHGMKRKPSIKYTARLCPRKRRKLGKAYFKFLTIFQ